MKEFNDALFLEDFDLENMMKWNPKAEVWVSVGRLYAQMARYRFNSDREEEINILNDAISRARNKKSGVENRYTIMTINDIFKCFGGSVKDLPKSTFMKA